MMKKLSLYWDTKPRAGRGIEYASTSQGWSLDVLQSRMSKKKPARLSNRFHWTVKWQGIIVGQGFACESVLNAKLEAENFIGFRTLLEREDSQEVTLDPVCPVCEQPARVLKEVQSNGNHAPRLWMECKNCGAVTATHPQGIAVPVMDTVEDLLGIE